MKAETLKKSILQYAMQGKLVAQDPNDEPASELLKRIKVEKEQLIKDGKIKKEKPLPPITEEEILYELPQGWEWVRFQNITQVLTCGYASTPQYYETGRIFLSAKNIKPYKFMPENHKFISEELYQTLIQNGKPEKGDILMTRVGAGIGESAIIDIDMDFAIYVSLTLIKLFKNNINPNYILHWLNSPYGTAKATKHTFGKGCSQGNLNVNQVRQYVVPLPPLAEQQRIVEKLEEILPLVEEYGKNEEILSEMNKKLPKQIRQSILQYAVQGKLVSQNQNDEPASELLKRIKAEKEQLIKDGKILKKKPLEPFSADDIPFEIPKTWEWVYLSDVSIIQEGAGIRSYQYRDSGTQLLTVTNILEGGIDLQKSTKFVDTNEYLEKYKHLTPQIGDIVTACSGGSWGKSAIYDKEDITMLNTSTLRLRFFSDLADNKYLYFITKSGIFKNQLECQLSGMQPNFGYQHYSKILIPLPPLAEQQRIVTKVEELMQIVDKLE